MSSEDVVSSSVAFVVDENAMTGCERSCCQAVRTSSGEKSTSSY